MFRSFLRAIGAALFLIVVGTGAVIIYFWVGASQLMSQAEDKGWLAPPASEPPLSIFETIAAKNEFGETWDTTGIPCRAVSRVWVAFDESRNREPMPVSLRLARDLRYDLDHSLDFWNGPREIAFACLLEGKENDTRLLRLWLPRQFMGRDYENLEAASQGLFGKPTTALDQAQSAKLAALISSPNSGRDTPELDRQAKLILERIGKSASR